MPHNHKLRNVKNKLLYVAAIIGVIVVAVGISSYLLNSRPEPRQDAKKHTVMTVKAEKVAYKDIKTSMKYRGRVTAFNNVDLTAEVSGRLLKGDIRFKEGETFKKDDVIVRIFKEDKLAAYKANISSFLQSLANILPDIKIDYADEYEKWNNFFVAIDPEKKLPQLPKIDTNQEKVFLSANNVLTQYYNLQNQQIELTKYTIIAPFDGILKAVNKEIGSAANTGATLATLIRSDKYEIVAPVFSNDIKWIKKGDVVTLTDKYYDEEQVTVSRIAGFVDEETQSVNVYLTYNVSGSKTHLLEGEYVDLTFKGNDITGFEIPREAVVNGSFVYTLKDGALEKNDVTIVRSLSDTYVITGIEEGLTIVTESLASVSSNVEYIAR